MASSDIDRAAWGEGEGFLEPPRMEAPLGRYRSQPNSSPGSAEHARSSAALLAAISHAKEGDRDAIRYLYCRYADRVYAYVCTILHDEHEAEDVTQNVFAKLITSIGSYQRGEAPFSAWLLKVARNASLDLLRRRRPIPIEDTSEWAGHDLRAGASSGAVQAALASLPDDQQRVVLMRHLVGLSPGEIAQRSDKTEAAVHGLHHRGRAKLRQELTALQAKPCTRPRAAERTSHTGA